jgi:glycosyltransferase involved in cell wall biosynthesis
MKIIHIITGLNDGGAEAVLFRLCTYDKTHCHAVISMMDAGKYGSLLHQSGIEVHCLNMPRGKITLNGILQLWRLLKTSQVDAVQTWMYHANVLGGLIARLAGIKNVIWGIHHTTLETGSSKNSTIFLAKLSAYLSRWIPRRIVYCAQRARQVHVALGYEDFKSVVISNGYDLRQFAPSAPARMKLRSELGIEETETLLGMVGRFDPQKHHANLLAALAELKQQYGAVRCLLVGSGLEKTNAPLLQMITDYGLVEQVDVMLLGQRNDISAVMNALDVHVLSSAYGEAFPNVLAEAMACGTPCVTTDVGDAALIVASTGWSVNPRNSKALAGALSAAILAWKDRNRWEQRKLLARQHIDENFSIERMTNSYYAAWL